MKKVFLFFLTLSIAACAQAPSSSVATETQISDQQSAISNSDEASVRAVVEGFGQRLQNVALLSDSAPFQIMQEYGHYVAPELLVLWATDPFNAPGRQTSSPWPDRIEISSVLQKDANTYLVTGSVIEITSQELMSGGVAAQYPVTLKVKKIGESWLITAFEKGDYQ